MVDLSYSVYTLRGRSWSINVYELDGCDQFEGEWLRFCAVKVFGWMMTREWAWVDIDKEVYRFSLLPIIVPVGCD